MSQKVNCQFFYKNGDCCHSEQKKVFFGLLNKTCVYLDGNYGEPYSWKTCDLQREYIQPELPKWKN